MIEREKMFIYILILWNTTVFLLYGYDKLMAIKDGLRVSEKTLLMSAVLLGGLGAYFGMICFRHKTKHMIFRVLLPLFAVIEVFVFLYIH